MPILNSILEATGNTPLIRLSTLFPHPKVEVLVKVEAFNPSSSIKVRIALSMIEEAETKGILSPNSHIVEPTSGNTGIGLAMVCAVKGYKITLVMPENASLERRKILRAYGAEVILTPTDDGIPGSIAKAKSMAAQDPLVFVPNQFENPANPLAHEMGTAIEIWKDTDGHIDVFVAAVGTGGTLTGTARKLKNFLPSIEVVAVEPEKSRVLSGYPAQIHKIQGMGAGFVPSIVDRSLIDTIVAVSEERAYDFARKLAHQEGIFAGISSGAALAGVEQYLLKKASELDLLPHKLRIVTILPDTGERYLSTDLW